MASSLSFRHYFSEVDYNQYYSLENNGELISNTSYQNLHDTTYNSWNIDLRFTWWFAPGSQLTFLYRNAIDSFFDQSGINYSENLNLLFEQPQFHSVSLRISYFLDYNRTIKKVFENKKASSQPQNNFEEKMNLGRQL